MNQMHNTLISFVIIFYSFSCFSSAHSSLHYDQSDQYSAHSHESISNIATEIEGDDGNESDLSDGLSSVTESGIDFDVIRKVRTTRNRVFRTGTEQEQRRRLEDTAIAVQCAKSILEKIDRENIVGISASSLIPHDHQLTQSEVERRKAAHSEELERQAKLIIEGLFSKKGEKKNLKDQCKTLYAFFVHEIGKLSAEIEKLNREKERYEGICAEEIVHEQKLTGLESSALKDLTLNAERNAEQLFMQASRIELDGIKERKQSSLSIKQACEQRVLILGEQLAQKSALLAEFKIQLTEAKEDEEELRDIIGLIDEAMLCVGLTVPGVVSPLVVDESTKGYKEYIKTHHENPLYEDYFGDDQGRRPYPPLKEKGLACLLL